jgi:hypothetical protein
MLDTIAIAVLLGWVAWLELRVRLLTRELVVTKRRLGHAGPDH